MPISISLDDGDESLSSIQAIKSPGDNYLAKIDIEWLWVFMWPEVNFTMDSSGQNFEFPQDSEGYVKLNFTVDWRHKLKYEVAFPKRWTHVHLQIYEEKDCGIEYIYLKKLKDFKPYYEVCSDYDWKDFTIYIDQNNESDPGWLVDKIETNNSTKTYTVAFIITGFPPFSFLFSPYLGEIVSWYITVTPI